MSTVDKVFKELARDDLISEMSAGRVLRLAAIINVHEQDFRKTFIEFFRKACTPEQWKEIVSKMPTELFYY
ncbi:hypothetical protein PP744_gp028 [Rhizobium phage RHph_N38]|uniref:Uncharacterized protein n=1 Tax=Rhizobium phage RHph_N38 TaxID=2509750 RepID=A0A7S5UVM2_9CAUD|nr:hypothetical protein PP744_gp028 [Rhizobium phage RHph_N38]QIG70491.1 hypothetical protein EVB89_028 [Rhizobium phage RHph_N38]